MNLFQGLSHWFRQRWTRNTTLPELDLTTLYTRFQSLPEPTIEAQRQACKEFRAEVDAMIGAADEQKLKPDLFKLMLEALIREFQIPVETIKANFKQMKGEWKIEAQERHWAIPLLAENLARYLDEEGGPNFAEIVLQMMVSGNRHPDIPGFVLTLQRLDGKCPADLLAECKQELATLKARSREWQISHAWLEGRNTSLAQLDDENPYIGGDPKLEKAWDDGWLSEVDDVNAIEESEAVEDTTAVASLYAQRSPHGTAYIVGNLTGLCKILNGLVYSTIQAKPQTVKLFGADGEAYDLVVVRQEKLESFDLQTPYTDDGSRRPHGVHPATLSQIQNAIPQQD